MLIFIFIAISFAVCPPANRDNLIDCFRKLLDSNRDSIITVSEIDYYLRTQTCLSKVVTDHLSGTIIMNTCDLNRDGQLTLADWTPSNACVTVPKRVEMICNLCERCGWDGMKKK
jgi:hypothetical protein